jgi:hypothetical protein
MLVRWFQTQVLSRIWLTFVILGLSFFGFGVGSLNLFYLLNANAHLLAEHGLMAALDGGLQQLLEILGVGYLSLSLYVVFKACEQRLARWLAGY